MLLASTKGSGRSMGERLILFIVLAFGAYLNEPAKRGLTTCVDKTPKESMIQTWRLCVIP